MDLAVSHAVRKLEEDVTVTLRMLKDYLVLSD